jgi:hypothetical protein
MMVSGGPWSQQICCKNISAWSEAELLVWQGTKCHIFVRQSATTHMVSCPSDNHSPLMKSIEILVHGFNRTRRDLTIPAGHCWEVRLHWQVWQLQRYLAMSLRIPNEINSWVTISKVLAWPEWPDSGESWCCYRTCKWSEGWSRWKCFPR